MSHQVPDKKRKQSQTTLQFQPIQKKSTKEKSNTEYNSRLKQQRSLEEEDYDYYDDTQDVEEEEDAGDQRPPKNININKMHSGFARRVPVASPTARKTPTNQPVQKLSIKPFKVKPKLPEQFEQETWEKLQEAVRAVHKKEKVAYSQEELYKAVQDMCLHKMAPSLYEKLYNQCEEHVKEKLNALVGQTPDHLAFLSMVQNAWDDHCNQMLTIRSIFLYLDRTYVLQTQNLSSLWDMGLQLFCKHVIKEPEIERKTVAGLLHLIEQERKGDQIDKPLVSSLLRMFMALGIYESSFEKIFLEETTKFYSEEGQRLMLQLNVPEYLIHVQTRLKEETERAKQYLAMSTRKPLITTVERELIGKHVQAILEKGFDNLVETNRIEDLGRLYNLLSLVNGLDNLKKFFCAYIKRSGLAIVADEEADKVMIEKLLEFKEKMDYILEHPFQNNENFRFSMKDAFETCINSRQNKPAELIAKFIDTKLKAGKGTSEDELEQIMDKVMILFRYIHGKDVFEAFYKKDLAKRLLLGRSASIDAEKSMIAKLKIECGSTFTNKLEGMFKDIELSKDIMASFRQSKDAKKIGDIDLYVNVLTTGYWPPYVPTEAKLPKDVAQCQEVFRSFYLGKHSGRRLLWQNSLGMCVLRAHYQQGNKEFSVSVFQAVVLLLFNDEDKISFKQIKEATGIEDGELRRTLQSLACAKVRVLKKNPKGREVEDDDVFSYDPNFTHPKIRIKINQIQMKETVEENTSTTEKVFKDRQYQIDAAVVRIMKSRKSLSHNILVSELFAQLKFPLKSSDLKKRIESLIDREYLERDPSNPSVYNYLA